MSKKTVNIFELKLPGKSMEFGAHLLPAEITKNNLDWVVFGDKPDWLNQQPQYYDYLSKLSSKNGAILKTKDRYVWGKGFKLDTLGLSPAEEINAQGFINNLKSSRIFKRLISDRNKNGGFTAEMIPTKKGDKVIPHYLPFKNIRVGKKEFTDPKKDEKAELLPTKYYFTSDWSLSRSKIESAVDFTIFEAWSWEEDFKPEKDKRYIVYWKDEGFEDVAYPLPDYQGGVPYIDADTEVGNFVFNNVKNGFTSGLLVQFFNGDPGDTQKAELTKMWHDYLHGSENAGKAMMAWLDNKDQEVKVDSLSPNGQDDRYINLNAQINKEVFIAHCLSPQVVGMDGSGGFSNNADERRVAIEAFNSGFVSPTQEPFNDFFNQILSHNGLKGTVELELLDPIRVQFSENILKEISTLDEIREQAGLEKSQSEPNKQTEILSTLSPLLATKVLEVMTTDEKRAIIELKSTGDSLNRITKEIIREFSTDIQDELFIAHFEKTGIPDEELEILEKREFCATDIEDAERQAIDFRLEHFQTKIAESLLKILVNNPNLSLADLAELLDLTEEEVQELLDALQEEGKIDENNNVLEQPEEEIFTVYKYVKRSDISGPDIIDGTRDFCKSLVRQSRSKSWTIEDIKLMNNGMGLDVFRSRGGWRTLPGTNTHQPFCRHIWEANLVRRKPA